MSKSKSKAIEQNMSEAIKLCDGHLGDIIAWSLQIGRDGIDPEDLLARATRAGMDPDDLPSVPKPVTATRRAIREVARASRGYRVEIVTDNPGVIVWGVSKHQLSEGTEIGDSAAVLVNRIALLRVPTNGHEANELVAENDEDPIYQEIAERATFYRTRLLAAEILNLIKQKLADWNAVPLSVYSGVYFVAAEYADEVKKLRKTIDGMGPSSFFAFPLPAVDDARRSIGAAAREALEKEVADIKAELDEWRQAEYLPGRGALDRRLELVGEIQRRAKSILKVTKTRAKDLTQTLAEVRSEIERVIDEGFSVSAPDAKPEDSPNGKPTPPAAPEKPKPIESPEKLTQLQLRRELRLRGIKYAGLNKAGMVAALRASAG